MDRNRGHGNGPREDSSCIDAPGRGRPGGSQCASVDATGRENYSELSPEVIEVVMVMQSKMRLLITLVMVPFVMFANLLFGSRQNRQHRPRIGRPELNRLHL